MEKARVVSGISPGHPGYLGALQREISSQWKKLKNEEREGFQDLADEWSSQKAPEAVMRR